MRRRESHSVKVFRVEITGGSETPKEDFRRPIEYFWTRYPLVSRVLDFLFDMIRNYFEEMIRLQRRSIHLLGRIYRLLREGSEVESVTYRVMDKEEAKRLIEELIKSSPGVSLSEIVEETDLDPEFVLECVKELENEGKIEGKVE